ncbi:cell division protein FtsQ/DivIB [Ligilactobacillus sp. Marseille-Q7487]|jgi:cell division protein FtsQ|uniref:cell division protein FtsQ/DivIB n=1 Tax=Ligilactobacillus sp. Marseille-Q7487 TaxID=3022128 RepID=UPI0015B51593|nr:cell division protein FtsQ/DivIB [Ligilactobacillus sp. Marseille-Q7487]
MVKKNNRKNNDYYANQELTPWEIEQQKRQKRQQKQQKKQRFKPESIKINLPKLKESRQKRLRLRMSILLAVFGTCALVMLFFILPFSRVCKIIVQTNDPFLRKEVIQASGLSYYESLFDVKPHTKQLEQKITQHVGEVKSTKISYQTSTVIINVKTYPLIGYVLKDNQYYKLTTSGIPATLAEKNISGNYPVFYGGTKKQIKKMAKQLSHVAPKIINAISEVHFIPTKADPGKVHLYMNDGNEVIATTATFDEKIGYYPGIAESMGYQGIVDLEVGAYSYPYSQTK